jgi:hypothetical protein
MPSVLIATPVHRGDVKALYATALARTIADLERSGIMTDYATSRGANLPAQRDLLASRFLTSAHTHVLFVDDDMYFPADLARKLLAFDKPFMGVVCTKREIDFRRVDAYVAQGLSVQEAIVLAHTFASIEPGMNLKVSGDLVSLPQIGFGFVLLRRDCFEKMQKRCDLLRYSFNGSDLIGFFQPVPSRPELAEDLAFCRRWAHECGESVFAYAPATVTHVGDFSYGAPFSQWLDIQKRLAGRKGTPTETP